MYLLTGLLWVGGTLAFLVGIFVPNPFLGNSRLWAGLLAVGWFVVGGLLMGDPPRAEMERQAALKAAQHGSYDDVAAHPAQYLTFVPRAGSPHYGSDFVFSGRLKNESRYPLSDIKFKCQLFAKSGTKRATLKVTLFQTVPASGELTFKDLDAGDAPDQTNGGNCQITGASVRLQ